MALDPDPYRILELPPGATLDEVKRAYRRLAKVHHPDAAGEAALPRFLAIQAAYEQLLTGAPPGARGRRASGAPRRAWEADPDRSDATRRAYGGRARTAPPGGASAGGAGRSRPGGTPSGGTSGTAGERAGARATGDPAGPATGNSGGAARAGSNGAGSGTGSSGATGAPGTAGARAAGAAGAGSRGPTPGRSRRRRTAGDGSSPGQEGPPNPDAGRSRRTKRSKATLGSTSYDGADGPFEPDWRGASWYGTTSGTYWTLNPKEYADPRKHGPEYQARARRAVRARQPEVGATDAAAEAPSTAGTAPAGMGAGGPGQTPGPTGQPVSEPIADPVAGPTHTTSSWWDSTTGPAAAASGGGYPEREPSVAEAGAWAGDHRRPPAVEPPPDLGRAAEDILRALTDERLGGVRGRVARAIIGWLPIAFGIGWIVGELTGCGRFAATCDGSADPLVMILQVAVLAVLLVVPVVASIATMATLALFGAAIVAALILSATGSAADGDSRRVALGAVLLVAWFVGLAIAVMRRLRTLSSPTRPVS